MRKTFLPVLCALVPVGGAALVVGSEAPVRLDGSAIFRRTRVERRRPRTVVGVA